MKNRFLKTLEKEGKLELVEPSDEICFSYSGKADNCLKSAKLLLQNKLYENSISMSYYAMYNLLLALLFKAGIKCENHSGSILLLKLLFKKDGPYETISNAKKERIDKQYYVATEKNELTAEIANELLDDAEDFLTEIKTIIESLNNDAIEERRESFTSL